MLIMLTRNLTQTVLKQFSMKYIIHNSNCHSYSKNRIIHTSTKKISSVKQLLHDKILSTGPISVSEFMRLALTYPDSGYYMNRDVLGVDGDFVTSPELSQMFGELLAVWFMNEWSAMDHPRNVQIVEFGPGRGTLAVDMLRTFADLKKFWGNASVSLHLIEVSPTLSQIQFQNLCETPPQREQTPLADFSCFLSGTTRTNMPVFWHKTLDTVPADKSTFFIAHEFFDALPVHKFRKVDDAWKEIYVDICEESKLPKFRFVLMPVSTPACKTLIQANEERKELEISPQSALVCQNVANRISKRGGAALIADYGHLGTKEDTLRGFKHHEMVDVLSEVGDCDITADVDFLYLKNCLQNLNVDVTGPVSQHVFLQNMGIDTRLMMLLRGTSDADLRRRLIGAYDVIMNREKMGERFKFMAITSRDRKSDGDHSRVTGF